jgi:predicted TIM-barrel fold metal-dependent hydrolase
MTTVVDFHVHVFPDNLSKWISKIPNGNTSELISQERISHVRKRAREWIRPFASSLHGIHANLRYLPDVVRKGLDEISGLVPLPSLLVESTPSDLAEAMSESGIDYAVAIAHPSVIENEFILGLCEKDPKLIPAVNISKRTSKPGSKLKAYAAQGAKILKIHAASDGEGQDSPRYRSLLRAASDLAMPVIVHTGCLNCHLFLKDPSLGSADQYTKWYETYPDIQFILAHMNFHQPHTALDLCEKYPNLYVDTSWQPAEMIGEAARRIGADRVLFGTDWPLIGNNLSVGKNRVQECVDTGLLNEQQSKLILGENALKLLGISSHAT